MAWELFIVLFSTLCRPFLWRIGGETGLLGFKTANIGPGMGILI